MRSIRLSLMVYFLALLGLALGAVSWIVYSTVYQTLQAKQAATAELIKTQYQTRCQEEKARLDEALLYQAKTLNRLTQFRHQGYRWREAHAGVLLATGTAPLGPVLTPLWVNATVFPDPQHQPAFWGRLIYDMYRGNPMIQFDETELLKHVDGDVAEYFQVNSELGSYRSLSLGENSLPFDPMVFAKDVSLDWKHDDRRLASGTMVRRVQLTAPAARLFPPNLWPGSSRGRSRNDDRGNSGTEERTSRSDDRSRQSPTPRRPVLLVQCACDTAKLEAALAALAKQRDEDLERLGIQTAASLTGVGNILLLVGLATFGASVAGGSALVWLGLTSLRRLSDAVSRVSEKDFRLPLEHAHLPVELKPIAARLTQTLDLLKRAFAREKQATADISHELRTPLTAMMTTMEVALRKSRSPEEYRELLEDCRASGQQMTRLVERLLVLARLDAGVDRLRARPVDVTDLTEQCASMVRPLAEARQLTLEFHPASHAEADTDPDKFREVLTNLLQNAIQYNRPAGRVDVSVGRANGHLEVKVSDTGVGIQSEALPHIFERFYRADPSRQSDGLNAGLGLAIVKGYVDLMGGSIDVESVVGQGSTFRVRLPAKQGMG